ncbi:MAG: molybdopterin-synthase adenylyltransferase MoeB [Gammaproteobacteria bacterium]|nr:molybdopterin-synthase adenylyltransferase MoeB [Gammaproteobacteria bacterium]
MGVDTLRYARHIVLPEVGLAGQTKLNAAKVLCVGAGGLGSPLLLYLAAAGVGTIGIVDDDSVDISNLQRQILYTSTEVGRSKCELAKKKLLAQNLELNVITYKQRLTPENAGDIIQKYDVVADCTDNFQARYLINDTCFLYKKPNVYASVFRFEGQCSVFNYPSGPCLRCLFANPPPDGLIPHSSEAGLMGVLPGVMGVIQATEILKIILGIGDLLVGRLLLFNALLMQFREFPIRKDLQCRVCKSAN